MYYLERTLTFKSTQLDGVTMNFLFVTWEKQKKKDACLKAVNALAYQQMV